MTMTAKMDPATGPDSEFEYQEPVDGASPEELRLIEAAEKIRLRYKGIRVRVSGMPQSRKVSDAQKARMAEEFGSDKKFVSASTLLWDADEPLVKDVRSVIASINRAWHDRSKTMPTTTDGLRKIKKECVGEIHRELTRLKAELERKCEALEAGLPGIISRLREGKKQLFNPRDYEGFVPTRDIKVSWQFPVVAEDQELAELDDEVYQHELRRIRSEGAAAVKKFEHQLAEQLVEMLDAIVERLEGETSNGKRKIFRDDTVLKVFDELEFFNKQLQELGVGGEAMEQAMKRIGMVVGGQSRETLPDSLRKGTGDYREHVKEKFTKIAQAVADKAVAPERRKVLRRKLTSAALGGK